MFGIILFPFYILLCTILFLSLCFGIFYFINKIRLPRKNCFYICYSLLFLSILFTVASLFFFCNVVFCEEVEEFQAIIEFNNLHLTESLIQARNHLNGVSGIYSLTNQDTGSIYIGSAVNLWDRLYDHVINHSSNLHLQRAMAKYGLAVFTFKILEQCNPAQLLEREQYFLNKLFSLPEYLRYNFSSIAGSPFGYRHTKEALAKMSAAATGANNGRAVSVTLYDLQGNIVKEFSTITEAATFIGISRRGVGKAIEGGFIVKGMYRVSRTPVDSL
jgi:hypothetical protein